MKTAAEVIEYFRGHESAMDLAAVVDRPEAARLLAAWPPPGLDWHEPRSAPPEAADDATLWLWLWGHADLDVAAYVASCGVPIRPGLSCFEAILARRLVYPDGTRAEWADRLVKLTMKRATQT